MTSPNFTGKRVLVLGAETEVGRAVVSAVAEAGASVAAVAATSDAEAAFGVQRLARRLASGERKVIAQAIDATNEAAVRVMVRQVSKELGGLDAVVDCARTDDGDQGSDSRESRAHTLIWRLASKEFDRVGGGRFVEVKPGWWRKMLELHEGEPPEWRHDVISFNDKNPDTIAAEVVAAIAGEPRRG